MKTLIIITTLLVAVVAETQAKEKTDWNALANKLIGKWQGTKLTPRADYPKGMPIPKINFMLTIRENGTARMISVISGEPLKKEDKQDLELMYVFNKDVIIFYSPKDKELFNITSYVYRIKDSSLELDFLGGAPVTVKLKKLVEQGGADDR